MLISQLMLAPLLIFCTWLFWILAPQVDTKKTLILYNIAVCLLALGLSVLALFYINASASGANDKIWHPVLSALSSYAIFPLVLFLAGIIRMILFAPSRR